MRYIILGLNTLGRALGESLTKIGDEVIGVDHNPQIVDAIKHSMTGAICLDSTDEDALSSLPLGDMDAVVVAYGKDFGVSVKTVALLKNLKVENIIVRSISPIHEAVVKAIGVSEIISPEKEFASIYTSRALLGTLYGELYKINDVYNIYKIKTPDFFVGQSLQNLRLEENFNLKLIAIEHREETKNILGLTQKHYKIIDKLTDDYLIEDEDLLLLFGNMEAIRKLVKI